MRQKNAASVEVPTADPWKRSACLCTYLASVPTRDDLRRSMTFLADGRVQAQPLHSRTVPLAELEATLQRLSAGPSDEIKVLVDPR